MTEKTATSLTGQALNDARKSDREDRTAAVLFEQKLALMLAHDGLLYESAAPAPREHRIPTLSLACEREHAASGPAIAGP